MAPPDEQRCRATSTRSGNRCNSYRVKGAMVCIKHGGGAPQVKAKAAAREAEREMRIAFGRLSDHSTPVEDPFAALAQVAGEVLAWKEFCAGRIADLSELGNQDAKGTEQTVALIALFERAMDRAVSTLAAIAKLGIEDRMARVNERQAETVVRAVNAGLVAAGLSGPEITEARAVVARELRVVP